MDITSVEYVICLLHTPIRDGYKENQENIILEILRSRNPPEEKIDMVQSFTAEG